jgi:capsular polysaccharide transport system permease protein
MTAPVLTSRKNTGLWASLQIQARIVRALIIREVLHRYGTENLGFFWVFGEPMLLCFGVMVLWTLLRNNHGGTVGVVPFALTGYSHIQLWRHCVFGASRSITHSSWLAYHSNVQTLDILMAKCLMSSIGIFGAFLIAYLILYVFGFLDPMTDPLLVCTAWALDTLFCFGFALIVTGLSEMSGVLEKLLHPVMYLTMPLTGTFTMTAWMPPKAREILVWSPLVNACEMFRAGVFPEDVQTYWDPWFILLSSLALIAIGVPLTSYVRRHVEVH